MPISAAKSRLWRNIKKPINEQQGKDDSEMTEEEIKKQRELFVAKLKVMQSNYELSHPKPEKNLEV